MTELVLLQANVVKQRKICALVCREIMRKKCLNLFGRRPETKENHVKSQEVKLTKFLSKNHTVISYYIHSQSCWKLQSPIRTWLV